MKKKIKINSMEKVKIKRVNKIKKVVSTKEKILAGLGASASLVGMGTGGAAKSNTNAQKPFVRVEQQNKNSSKTETSKARDILNKVFGIQTAKADYWDCCGGCFSGGSGGGCEYGGGGGSGGIDMNTVESGGGNEVGGGSSGNTTDPNSLAGATVNFTDSTTPNNETTVSSSANPVEVTTTSTDPNAVTFSQTTGSFYDTNNPPASVTGNETINPAPVDTNSVSELPSGAVNGIYTAPGGSGDPGGIVFTNSNQPEGDVVTAQTQQVEYDASGPTAEERYLASQQSVNQVNNVPATPAAAGTVVAGTEGLYGENQSLLNDGSGGYYVGTPATSNAPEGTPVPGMEGVYGSNQTAVSDGNGGYYVVNNTTPVYESTDKNLPPYTAVTSNADGTFSYNGSNYFQDPSTGQYTPAPAIVKGFDVSFTNSQESPATVTVAGQTFTRDGDGNIVRADGTIFSFENATPEVLQQINNAFNQQGPVEKNATTNFSVDGQNYTMNQSGQVFDATGHTVTLPENVMELVNNTAAGHTVVAGEFLSQIANDAGTTVDAIRALNPSITNPNQITVGQYIVIPGENFDPNSQKAPDSQSAMAGANLDNSNLTELGINLTTGSGVTPSSAPSTPVTADNNSVPVEGFTNAELASGVPAGDLKINVYSSAPEVVANSLAGQDSSGETHAVAAVVPIISTEPQVTIPAPDLPNVDSSLYQINTPAPTSSGGAVSRGIDLGAAGDSTSASTTASSTTSEVGSQDGGNYYDTVNSQPIVVSNTTESPVTPNQTVITPTEAQLSQTLQNLSDFAKAQGQFANTPIALADVPESSAAHGELNLSAALPDGTVVYTSDGTNYTDNKGNYFVYDSEGHSLSWVDPETGASLTLSQAGFDGTLELGKSTSLLNQAKGTVGAVGEKVGGTVNAAEQKLGGLVSGLLHRSSPASPAASSSASSSSEESSFELESGTVLTRATEKSTGVYTDSAGNYWVQSGEDTYRNTGVKAEDGTYDAKGNWVVFNEDGKPQYVGVHEDANGNLSTVNTAALQQALDSKITSLEKAGLTVSEGENGNLVVTDKNGNEISQMSLGNLMQSVSAEPSKIKVGLTIGAGVGTMGVGTAVAAGTNQITSRGVTVNISEPVVVYRGDKSVVMDSQGISFIDSSGDVRDFTKDEFSNLLKAGGSEAKDYLNWLSGGAIAKGVSFLSPNPTPNIIKAWANAPGTKP